MHLYFPFVTQGIDLVGELGHVLIGHDTLALGNQRQQTSCRSQQPLEDSGDRLRLFLHGNRCSLIGKFIADQVELRATLRCVSPLPILDLQAFGECSAGTVFTVYHKHLFRLLFKGLDPLDQSFFVRMAA